MRSTLGSNFGVVGQVKSSHRTGDRWEVRGVAGPGRIRPRAHGIASVASLGRPTPRGYSPGSWRGQMAGGVARGIIATSFHRTNI